MGLGEENNMVYKYDEKNKRVINEGFNVIDIYTDSSEIDYVVINLDGEHGSCKNSKNIKYWIILDGKGTVYLNNETYEVVQGDFIIIDKNVKHNIIGKIKFGVISVPAFDASSETYY